ncbi:MAG: porin [Acidobacteriota bacterium]
MRSRIGLVVLLVLTVSGTAVFADGATASPPYLPVLSSYIQFRYTDPSKGDDAWAIRRFKAMLDGGPQDGLHYHVQFVYKTNLSSSTDDQIYLQDAYVVVPESRGLAFKVGQFVPPFGLERFEPDSALDLIDRTDLTNRMVVNGNLGKSFARDRGVEGDFNHGGWEFSAGLFQGEGANMNGKGNGPLGVARLSYGGKGLDGGTPWFWRTGLAASDRHDADMNLSSELTGLSKKLTSRFAGRDSRLNAFAEAGWGKVRSQAEYFRAWLSPDRGGEIIAHGAYGQVAYLPIRQIILALRYEWFTPDLHAGSAPSLRQWDSSVTYDFRRVPLRLVADYLSPRGGSEAYTHTWRFQIQYVLLTSLRMGR